MLLKTFSYIFFSFLGSTSLSWAKDCQTPEAIRDHVALDSSGLVFSNGAIWRVVDDIESKFCVHTVVDGTKRLMDGKHISEFSFGHQLHYTSWRDFITKNALKVAFSDANGTADDGIDFEQAQSVCAALTIGGVVRGAWRTPRSRYGRMSEDRWDISAESLSVYFANPNLYDFERGRFWTGSITQSYIIGTGLVGEVSWLLQLGETCSFSSSNCARMDRGDGGFKYSVMCILDAT